MSLLVTFKRLNCSRDSIKGLTEYLDIINIYHWFMFKGLNSLGDVGGLSLLVEFSRPYAASPSSSGGSELFAGTGFCVQLARNTEPPLW
jgi:hypothetical protein